MYPGLGELGVEGVEVIEREIVDEENTCILGTSMRKEAPRFPNRRSSIAGLKTDRSPPRMPLSHYIPTGGTTGEFLFYAKGGNRQV